MLHAVTGAEPPCLPQEKSAQEKKPGPQICRQTTAEKLIQENHPDGTPSRNRTMLMKLKSKQTPRSRDSTEGKTNCKKRFFPLNLNKIHTIIEVTVISPSFDRKLKIIFGTLIL
jgi:hypothetical protein